MRWLRMERRIFATKHSKTKLNKTLEQNSWFERVGRRWIVSLMSRCWWFGSVRSSGEHQHPHPDDRSAALPPGRRRRPPELHLRPEARRGPRRPPLRRQVVPRSRPLLPVFAYQKLTTEILWFCRSSRRCKKFSFLKNWFRNTWASHGIFGDRQEQNRNTRE